MRYPTLTLLLMLAACTRTPEPAADTTATATPPPAQPAPTLTGPTWRWVRIVTPIETIEAPATGTYTLELSDSNRISGTADCNRMAGSYSADGPALRIGPLITTRMACPEGGLGTRYTQWLEAAANYFFRDDTLFVDLKMDSGTMRFVRSN